MKHFFFKYPWAIVIVLQLVLCTIAFRDFRMYPKEIIFSSDGDGLKNYFTLLSYVKQDAAQDNYFSYKAFNYPYGEYIYSADLTPSFAVPFKWFCNNIYDLSDHTLAIYNLFIVLAIVVCAGITYVFFYKTFNSKIAAFVLAMVLPWINMQTMRIWRGHMNLSVSWFIPLALLLLYYWHLHHKSQKKITFVILCMILLNVFSFFTHGYFVAILGIFQAAMLFFYALYHFSQKQVFIKSISFSIIVPLVSLGIVFCFLAATDGFLHLRTAGASGYDWMEQKVRFWGLFSHNDVQKSIRFPIKYLKGSIEPENTGYLGNMGLYAAGFVGILSIVSRAYRIQIKTIQLAFFKHPFFAPAFFGSLLMLIISFGENYYTDGFEGFVVYNYLNPLFYIHQFTDAVEQFRSLGRFSWPFFWGFYLWIGYTIIHLLPLFSRQVKNVVVIVVAILGGFEVKDYVDAMQARATQVNYLNPAIFPPFNKLKIDYKKYQALLAIPYYNVGSEDMSLIIDDWDASSRLSYQMALHSGLPLMNVKLSRTIVPQAEEMNALISADSMAEDLSNKFSKRPVLVMYDKAAATDSLLGSIPRADRPEARQTYWKTTELIQRNNLSPIDSLGALFFYEWFPKK